MTRFRQQFFRSLKLDGAWTDGQVRSRGEHASEVEWLAVRKYRSG